MQASEELMLLVNLIHIHKYMLVAVLKRLCNDHFLRPSSLGMNLYLRFSLCT